jgi:hypothetical protein
MREYEHTFNLGFVSPLFQLLLCLVGKTEDCTRLCGTAGDGEAMYKAFEKDNKVLMLCGLLFAQLQLSCYFGDWVILKHLLVEMKPTFNKAQINFVFCISMVFTALSHYEVFKKSKKRGHLRAARKYTKIIKSWVENGNVNCAPGLALLKAEEVSLKGDLLKIESAYDDAIGIADRDGFHQYEALATERAGLVFKEKGDKKRAIAYLRKSCLLYEQWGAMGKVEHIQQKYIREYYWYK